MTLSQSTKSRLQFQHETARELIEGYNEEQLKLRILPDKWSAFENLAHLVSYQPVLQQRIGSILVESNPSFERYVAENDPAFDASLQQPLEQLLLTLYSVRSQIWHQVQALSGDQLVRVALHSKYGELNIVQWIEFFLLHEAHHLFTMFKLLGEIGAKRERD